MSDPGPMTSPFQEGHFFLASQTTGRTGGIGADLELEGHAATNDCLEQQSGAD